MKYYLAFFVLLVTSHLFAQAEHVELQNRVYQFLERMENKHILSEYNSFEIPKTRKEITGYIKQVRENTSELTTLDQEMLSDLETEFEYDLNRTSEKSQRIIDNNGYDFFSDNQKYLYFLTDDKFNLFINLFAEFDYTHTFNKDSLNNNALLGSVGGIIRGTVNNTIGFYLKGSNGLVSGNREAALKNRKLAQNFKYTEKPEEQFFDYTEGHLSADFDYVRFTLGRERLKLGYGNIAIVDDNSPVFDQLGFNIKYKFFSYSFIHAKMLDYVIVPLNYSDKYLVYHRIGFNINKHFDFGAGEFVIYGRRGIDLSYLNPFAFYKSIEHSNRDRDNSMLFIDFNNNSIKSTKVHLELLVDDISYGKIGTGWYGNTVMLNAGVLSTDIFDLPGDIEMNYRRTEPYTFTHRLTYNNFTNLNYSLSTFAIPNSELFHAGIKYRLNYRLDISTYITYIIHGTNIESEGEIINYGGDIDLGYREGDSQNVKFLDGVKEYFRKIDLNINYEVMNQLFLSLQMGWINFSTQSEQSHKEFQSLVTLTTVF